MSSGPWKSRGMLLTVLFMISWVVTTRLAVHSNSTGGRMPVVDRIPDEFPVVVMSPSQGSSSFARILPHRKLKEYTASLESYSFLVPEGQAEELNRRLARGKRCENRFEVSRLPQGKQYLKVVYHWEVYEETGWYVADDKSFTPRYYQSGALPFIADIMWAPYTLLGNIIVWAMGIWIYRRARRR